MSYDELTALAVRPTLDRFHIVDVREAHEFHGPLGHLEGADLIPLSTIAEHAARLEGARDLLLVCRSGKRSGVACETLRERGVRNVTNLAGGMIGWNQAALPVIRTPLESIAAVRDSFASWLAQVTTTSRDEARARIETQLEAAGASREVPTSGSLESALDSLADALRESSAPADLEIIVDAYRADLSRFEE